MVDAVETADPQLSGERIRVMIVDDQAIIRRGLGLMLALESDIEVVGQAGDGQEAVDMAAAARPDVVLMDLQMPRLSGVAATRAITSTLPATQVVILTTFDTDDLVFEAIRAGAQAYLLKDADEAEVLDTVRAVHRGESRLAPHIARKVMDQFRRLPPGAAPVAEAAHDASRVTADDDPDAGNDALTKREERILSLIAEGRSNREIAATVFLAEGTVKNYVSRIMSKLHAGTRVELAVKALRPK